MVAANTSSQAIQSSGRAVASATRRCNSSRCASVRSPPGGTIETKSSYNCPTTASFSSVLKTLRPSDANVAAIARLLVFEVRWSRLYKRLFSLSCSSPRQNGIRCLFAGYGRGTRHVLGDRQAGEGTMPDASRQQRDQSRVGRLGSAYSRGQVLYDSNWRGIPLAYLNRECSNTTPARQELVVRS